VWPKSGASAIRPGKWSNVRSLLRDRNNRGVPATIMAKNVHGQAVPPLLSTGVCSPDRIDVTQPLDALMPLLAKTIVAASAAP
jgi:hypothetical protein